MGCYLRSFSEKIAPLARPIFLSRNTDSGSQQSASSMCGLLVQQEISVRVVVFPGRGRAQRTRRARFVRRQPVVHLPVTARGPPFSRSRVASLPLVSAVFLRPAAGVLVSGVRVPVYCSPLRGHRQKPGGAEFSAQLLDVLSHPHVVLLGCSEHAPRFQRRLVREQQVQVRDPQTEHAQPEGERDQQRDGAQGEVDVGPLLRPAGEGGELRGAGPFPPVAEELDQVRERREKQHGTDQRRVAEKLDEKPVVLEPNRVPRPGAVVIHTADALSGGSAVVRPHRSFCLALPAERAQIFLHRLDLPLLAHEAGLAQQCPEVGPQRQPDKPVQQHPAAYGDAEVRRVGDVKEVQIVHYDAIQKKQQHNRHRDQGETPRRPRPREHPLGLSKKVSMLFLLNK
mmetsp:Transcript_27762/g.70085  ORF Transcript_27762/g.70085 Transcript_27762/m.70085 type:complete len:397 (+) Transcript_27762:333-1523(+)